MIVKSQQNRIELVSRPVSLEVDEADEVAVVVWDWLAAEEVEEQEEAGVEGFRVGVAWLSPSSRVLTDPEASGEEGTPPPALARAS